MRPGQAGRARATSNHLSISRVTRRQFQRHACAPATAEDGGYIGRSPIPKRILPRVQETPPKRLSDAEVAKLLRLPDPWGFAIRLGLGTGLRWGEMMRARAEDVGTTSLTVSQTKSGRIRRIPLFG